MILLAGCGPFAAQLSPGAPAATASAPAPAVSPSPGPAATPTETPSAPQTPAPTATPVPSATATLTLVPTAAPTATPQLSVCAGAPVKDVTSAPGGRLRIAWVRAGAVWLWTEDGGAPEPLTEADGALSARLSPDGALVAYERQTGENEVEIWVVGAGGHGARRLASAAELRAMGDADPWALGVLPHNLSWIPGTRRLAFNTRPVYPEPRLYAADDLWTIDVETGEVEALLDHRRGGEFVFSPDGAQIAVFTPTLFSLIAADGSNLRWNILPGYRAIDMGGAYFYPQPAWALDSRSLRVGVPNPDDITSPNPRIDVWDIPLRGFDRTLVGRLQAFPPSLAFSPDLSLLAYLTWPAMEGGRRDLHLAALATPDTPTALYAQGGRLEFLGWAPGTRAFGFWVPASRRLQRGDACGTPTALTGTLTDYGSLRWVDAQRFLFVTGQPGEWTLNLAATGGEGQPLLELGEAGEYDFRIAD